ncbi:MAG: 4-(cytidine 5'-diphospho)-2-C-methyl-D-erythritol kinase [Gammaproteobacteria bacterium]
MESITLPAPAKLNLFLHITGQRDDGYHNLQTVFQLLDYGDTLTITPTDSKDIQFSCTMEELENSQNLVLRAAQLLFKETGGVSGAHILLKKVLPTGGGLGGGSSDAATTLMGLNRLWNCGLKPDELARLGLALGADVPVFVKGFSAWAEGVGELLQVIDIPERWYLVLTPDCPVSTGEVFSHPQLTRHTPAIKIAGFPFSGSKNDCETLVYSLYPEVKKVLDWLSCISETRMTGTGSSVFAAYETEQEARQALQQARIDLPGLKSAFVARGVNESPLHQALRKPL